MVEAVLPEQPIMAQVGHNSLQMLKNPFSCPTASANGTTWKDTYKKQNVKNQTEASVFFVEKKREEDNGVEVLENASMTFAQYTELNQKAPRRTCDAER